MRVWRIYSHLTPYARRPDFDPLSGAGGVKHAARWHHPGHKVVYTAANASLATLEIVVHVRPDLFGERRLLELEVPEDSLERVSEQAFIQLLRNAPPAEPEAATRTFGSEWLQQRRSLVLEVPSFVMPVERNYLLNPLHPRFQDVTIVRRELVTLDPRLVIHGLEAGT
ncbi:RES family NAD+ phosphorylase [soil metagenome]